MRDDAVKGCFCVDGWKQHITETKEVMALHTAAMELVLIRAMIEA